MKRLVILLIVLLVLLVGLIEFKPQIKAPQEQTSNQQGIQTPAEKNEADTFSHKGKEGVDALTLLQEKTTVEQNESGLVTSINKRKADEKKREFWSFYVNGKMANVGPKEYITKDTDLIEWKVETY